MPEDISNFANRRDSKHDLKWTNKPPFLSEISSLRGLWNPYIINCPVGNDLYLSLSLQLKGYRHDYLQRL